MMDINNSKSDLEIDLYSKETVEMIDFLKKEYHSAHSDGCDIEYNVRLERRDPENPHCLVMSIHASNNINDGNYEKLTSSTTVSIDPKGSKEEARAAINEGTKVVTRILRLFPLAKEGLKKKLEL